MKGQIDRITEIIGDLMPHLPQWMDHPDTKSIRKQWI